MNPTDPQYQPILPDAPEPQLPVQPAQPTAQSMDVVPPPPETPVPAEQPIQMPPYAPTQPPINSEGPVPEPVNPAQQNPIAQPAVHKKDTLGIISIVFGLLGAFPVGLILGLVGTSRAKNSQRSPVLSRIGWILSLVVMLVAVPLAALQIMSNLDAAKVKERDSERAKDMGAIEAKLEEFFTDNFGYPNDLEDLDFTDDQVLIGPNGSTIKVNKVVADEDEAKATASPTTSVEYTYTPYGKPTCLTTCDGYVLKSFVEGPTKGVTNPLIKFGLENL